MARKKGVRIPGAPGFRTRWRRGFSGKRASARVLSSSQNDPASGISNPVNGKRVAVSAVGTTDLAGPQTAKVLGAGGGSKAALGSTKGVGFSRGRQVIRNRGSNKSLKKR